MSSSGGFKMIQIVKNKHEEYHPIESSLETNISQIIDRLGKLEVPGISGKRVAVTRNELIEIKDALAMVKYDKSVIPRYTWKAWEYHSDKHIVVVYNPRTSTYAVIKKFKHVDYRAININTASSIHMPDGLTQSDEKHWSNPRITDLVDIFLNNLWIVCVHHGTTDDWLDYFNYISMEEYK